MNASKNQVLIIGVGLLVVVLLALVFLGVIPGLKPQPKQIQNATLTFWTVGEPDKAFADSITSFTGSHAGSKIVYRNFSDPAQYEATLINALAAGQGPDIFAIKNTGLMKDENKLVPVPVAKFTSLQLSQLFPDTVAKDFSDATGIYALPLSIDTLALVYNKDLWNQGGVPVAPKTWDEFLADVPKLTKVDQSGRVLQAGAALGSGSNVAHAADILSLLMLQNNVPMLASDKASAAFNTSAAEQALSFYTDFSNTGSSVYTWNDGMPNSEDAFAQGTAAMILDYQSSLAKLKSQNTFLNFGVAPVPQPKNAARVVTFPSYWGYGVSRQSRNPDLAWDFVLALTTAQTNVATYLSSTGRPPALRSFIGDVMNDPVLSVFGVQALTALAWTEPDPMAVDQIFSDAITAVTENQLSPTKALDRAKSQVDQLIAAQKQP